MKLNEFAKEDYNPENGDVICPHCNGTGIDSDEVHLCKTCLGNGFRDWIHNVIGIKYVPSTLDNINIRRLVLKIQHDVEYMMTKPEVLDLSIEKQEELIDYYLNQFHGTYIHQYKVDSYKKYNGLELEKIFNVHIQPVKSVEQIVVNFVVK